MVEQAMSAEQMTDRDTPELREELDRSREEVLRLRDLLIARDAELGATRGRLAEMEAQSGKLLNAAVRLRQLVPGFIFTTALAVLRRLRR